MAWRKQILTELDAAEFVCTPEVRRCKHKNKGSDYLTPFINHYHKIIVIVYYTNGCCLVAMATINYYYAQIPIMELTTLAG